MVPSKFRKFQHTTQRLRNVRIDYNDLWSLFFDIHMAFYMLRGSVSG